MRRFARLSGLLLALALLVTGEAGSSSSVASFTGSWTDQFTIDPSHDYATFPSPWTLVQTGSSVCIAYAGSGGGSGSGTVAGLTLTGSSKDRYGTSTFTVTLSADGQSAQGTWKRDNLSGDLKWTRAGPALNSSCSHSAPTGSSRGAPAMTFDMVRKDFESPTGRAWCDFYTPDARKSTDCHVKAGAKVTFCNRQNFHESLVSLSARNAFSKNLNGGECFSIRFKPGTVKIYSSIHSQMRLVLFVVP